MTTQPGLCPGLAKGLSVRNIKFASFPAPIGASTCAFDLLTVTSIRTVHWTVLISAPLESAIFFVFYLSFSQNCAKWGPSSIPNETVVFSYVSRFESHNQ